MTRSPSYKLLSKTTLIYLVFTLAAFLISAFFLTHEADEYINKELENRFNHTEKRIQRAILKNEIDRAKRYGEIFVLNYTPKDSSFVQYTDTLLTDTEAEAQEHFRKKTYIIRHNDTYYSVSIFKATGDFYRLRDDIFEALIPAFLILAFSIVVFNYFLSGYFFKPFNKILNHMRAYKVGKKNIDHVQTSTTEFIRMQGLFSDMVDRIDEDYDNLKEYTENMAHEIQTPLTVIRNKLENLMSDESVMQKQGKDIKIIFDETNYLSKLGQSLNLITRIENREFTDAKEIYTMQVIEKHLEAISESIKTKNLKVEPRLSPEHKVYLDPILLDIVLKNLIRNAFQYAKDINPIAIITEPGKLEINNYGEPLPFPKEKLFIRFQHNNDSQKSLGLGLAIVKKICDLNNLSIEYDYSNKMHIFSIKKAD